MIVFTVTIKELKSVSCPKLSQVQEQQQQQKPSLLKERKANQLHSSPYRPFLYIAYLYVQYYDQFLCGEAEELSNHISSCNFS